MGIEIKMRQKFVKSVDVVVSSTADKVSLVGRAANLEGFCLANCFDCGASTDPEHKVLDRLEKIPAKNDVQVTCAPRSGVRKCSLL